jgi:hypothetical protein
MIAGPREARVSKRVGERLQSSEEDIFAVMKRAGYFTAGIDESEM